MEDHRNRHITVCDLCLENKAMFKSSKLNKFCICFRGLKLGPSEKPAGAFPLTSISFSSSLHLILSYLWLNFFPSLLMMQTGFDEAGMHYMSITTWDMSFWKGCRYPEPLSWEQGQLSFFPGGCIVKWWDTVSLCNYPAFLELCMLSWYRRNFISKLDFFQVLLILAVCFECQLF